MSKILVVIGASSDIGMSFIKKYGSSYKKIIAFYRNCNDRLESLLSGYTENELLKVECDFSEEKYYKKLQDIQDAVRKFCGNDEIFMIHFPASPIKNKKYHKTEWIEFQNEIDIAIKSFVVCSHMFISLMIKQKKGKIVVCLSKAVTGTPPKYCADYVMVKFALLGLVRSLAVEYNDMGIKINAVSPTMVDTKFLVYQPEVVIEAWKTQSISGELIAPDKVADKIEWLFTNTANIKNGENFIVE